MGSAFHRWPPGVDAVAVSGALSGPSCHVLSLLLSSELWCTHAAPCLGQCPVAKSSWLFQNARCAPVSNLSAHRIIYALHLHMQSAEIVLSGQALPWFSQSSPISFCSSHPLAHRQGGNSAQHTVMFIADHMLICVCVDCIHISVLVFAGAWVS